MPPSAPSDHQQQPDYIFVTVLCVCALVVPAVAAGVSSLQRQLQPADSVLFGPTPNGELMFAMPTLLIGFLASFFGTRVSWLESLLGIAVGGGILFGVILLSGGGMGGGDMKLGAMMGAFLGYKLALLALFLAVILGGVVAVALLSTGVRKRKDPIPFGPFLALGGAITMLWGEAFLAWYLRMFSG